MTPALTTAIQLSLRAALSAGLAVAVAQFFQLESPVYALIAAVIVLDLSPSKTQQLARQRLAGTLLGATVGAALIYVLPPDSPAVVGSILAAMLLSHLLHLQAVAKLSGYVCGIVVLAHVGDPWSYAVHRTIETLLGIAAAVVVSPIPKLLRVEVPDGVNS